MAELTVTELGIGGDAVAQVACASGGDTFVNNGLTVVRVENTDSGDHTVTVNPEVSQVQVDTFGQIPIPTIAIGVSGTTGFTEFVVPVGGYGGKPTLTYDAVTNLTVSVRRLPLGL